MRLRAQLASTALVQGCGALAVFAAVVVLGAAFGPEHQGQFSRTKATVEFGGALVMFGMPQALYYYARSGRLALARARRVAWRLAVFGGLGYAAFVAWGGVPMSGGNAPTLGAPTLAVLAVAVAVYSLHGQWRALTLLAPRALGFNAVTALPQGLLLVAVLAAVWAWPAGAPPGAAWAAGCAGAFVLAYAAGSAVAARLLGRLHMPAPPPGAVAAGPARPSELAVYGAGTWLAACFVTAAALLAQGAALRVGGAAGLGVYTMAYTIAQGVLTPLNYALPLLLARRMSAGAPPRGSARAGVAALLVLGVMAAATAVAGAAWRSDLGLAGYGGLHAALAWLLVAAGAEALSRLAGVEAQAQGESWRVAVSELLRLAVLAAVLESGLIGSVTGLAQAWAAAAGVGAAVLVVRSKRSGA